MENFRKAIVRLPCENITSALTTVDLGMPDYSLVLTQHSEYIKALRTCGLEVTVMEADNRFPDSTFVEDTALMIPEGAVITRPGAASRQGETVEIETVLRPFVKNIYRIHPPGLLDAGDILNIDQHYYIGLSERTNQEGAGQIIDILKNLGFSGSTVRLQQMLHLKSGISYLGKGVVVVAGELVNHAAFGPYKELPVDPAEDYAANCIAINGTVLAAAGFPRTVSAIRSAGFPVMELEMSEFRKVDGGLSCLSLRF